MLALGETVSIADEVKSDDMLKGSCYSLGLLAVCLFYHGLMDPSGGAREEKSGIGVFRLAESLAVHGSNRPIGTCS